MNTFPLLLISILIPLMGFGQQTEIEQARQKIFQSYLIDDIQGWKKGIEEMEAEAKKSFRPSSEILYQLALAEYGLIGNCLTNATCDDVDERVKKAESYLEDLLDTSKPSAKAKALYGGFLAIKIKIHPAKAIYLGPRSASYIEESVKQNPNEPAAWVEMGNFRFHAPSLFGGDVEEAIECFDKAVDLFDKQTPSERTSWLYLHARVWKAKALEMTDSLEEAMDIYQNILEEYPNFTWISEELLPELQRHPDLNQ
ncbi:MAG: tetratricopeptide repeat protein [Bacteroidota bacterium]